MPRVLLIDDEPDILRLYRVFFEDAEFEVYEARTVDEAIQMRQISKPDAVILDFSIEGDGGARLIELMAVAKPRIPVFVSTGYSPETVWKVARPHQLSGVFLKGAAPTALVRAVAEAVAK